MSSFQNSPQTIFSVINHVNKCLRKYKHYTFKFSYDFRNLKIDPKFKERLTIIYSEMESGHYTYEHLVLYLITYYIRNNKAPYILNVNRYNIKKMLKLYKNARFKQDKELIDKLVAKNGLTIQDLYIVDESGVNSMYKLVKGKYVSPLMYVYGYKKEYLTIGKKCSILGELKDFHFLCDWIFDILSNKFQVLNILKGDLHG